MPYIVDIQSAFPKNYYSQEDLLQALKKRWATKYFNPKRLEDIHRHVLVGGRSLALPLPDYDSLKGFGARNQQWLEVAKIIGKECLSQLPTLDIEFFISNSVTGIAVPSLEARLMNLLPIPTDAKRIPIFGLGCLAGVAGLNRMADLLKGSPKSAGVFLSVELCSLTAQFDDLSIPNIISTGLFGDGAAAVLMVGDEHPLATNAKLKWLDGKSRFLPNTERVMGWDMVDDGFKIILGPEVPDVVNQYLPSFVDETLTQNNFKRSDLNFYLAHPGGPKVMQSMEEALHLPKDALAISWKSLQEQGNMSSVSVMCIMQKTLEQGLIPGKLGLAMALGPAFCAEVSLYESL